MVCAEDAINIYQFLVSSGIQIWITGGWGIDALLGYQSRAHKDLDVILLVDDVAQLREVLSQQGYGLKEYWSENRWTTDINGNEVATAFVLQDSREHQLDVHAMRFDEQGNPIPEWILDKGFILLQQDLTGQGVIAGVNVRCLTTQMQMNCHKGYLLPEYQVRDLKLLNEKFGCSLPEGYSGLASPET